MFSTVSRSPRSGLKPTAAATRLLTFSTSSRRTCLGAIDRLAVLIHVGNQSIIEDHRDRKTRDVPGRTNHMAHRLADLVVGGFAAPHGRRTRRCQLHVGGGGSPVEPVDTTIVPTRTLGIVVREHVRFAIQRVGLVNVDRRRHGRTDPRRQVRARTRRTDRRGGQELAVAGDVAAPHDCRGGIPRLLGRLLRFGPQGNRDVGPHSPHARHRLEQREHTLRHVCFELVSGARRKFRSSPPLAGCSPG